jgi:opacity protein-like surface antigen
MRGFLAGVAVCLGGLLPFAGASAADLSPAPPLQAPQYAVPAASRHYECYAGILGEAVVSHPDWNNVPALGATQENFAQGGRAGGVIGCDILFVSRTFIGIDMTAVYGRVRGSLGSTVAHDVPFEWAARVRFGFVLDDQFSIYVAGGPEDSYRKTTDFAGVVDNGFDWGGQAAIGIEYRFSSDWRVRGEYAFTWPGFDSIHITGLTVTGWNPTENLVRVAAIRRF